MAEHQPNHGDVGSENQGSHETVEAQGGVYTDVKLYLEGAALGS